ncbi:MAG: 50S ribosomal protein L4 [Candidatus Dojkabacteria bacterium]|nr:MAG: 50S ribosomal protein L4 [Candidatus Dojkabacteria bacterium]
MSLTLPIYNLEAKKVGDYAYTPFEEKMSAAMIAQVLRVYRTNQHQGTAQAKTRGEVSHPEKKPWRQKGTGRARHGSRNSPIWVGGGVTFGPRAHTKRLTLSSALKQKAMRYFLDQEMAQGSVVVFNEAHSVAKTKEAASFLASVNSFRLPIVVVLQAKDEKSTLVFRNIPGVTIRRASLLSPLDMNKKALYVFAEGALNTLVERISHDS